VVPATIQATTGFERVKRLDDAVEALMVNDEAKRKYLTLAGNVAKLYWAILPDAVAGEFAPRAILLAVLAEKIRSLSPPTDISEVMGAVEQLLDESIAPVGYVIRGAKEEQGKFVDLTTIDLDKLKAGFATSRKRTEAEKLRSMITLKLKTMVERNRSRGDYLDKFQRLIDEYNAGSKNIEAFFDELIIFAQNLNAEEKRGIAENLSEEELALFDILTKPDPRLSKPEEKMVKKVATELLELLKSEKLVLDWRKRQQSRAAVRLCIEQSLDQLPPTYTADVYQQKCSLTYQHIYDAYFGQGRSIYAGG
jgi:type I restriction enzyme, R subunit